MFQHDRKDMHLVLISITFSPFYEETKNINIRIRNAWKTANKKEKKSTTALEMYTKLDLI